MTGTTAASTYAIDMTGTTAASTADEKIFTICYITTFTCKSTRTSKGMNGFIIVITYSTASCFCFCGKFSYLITDYYDT